nr:hypothetical protein [Tanacetum cinerariifolium]
MVNQPPPNNDPNVSEGDQALVAPDGFAPQWIGEHDPNNNNRRTEWDVPLGGEVDEPMVGGPSTAAVEGPSAPFPALGLPVPPIVIEDLSTRLGNLEYKHGVSMRKMEEVSDAEVTGSIAIGEIHPRVATVEEQVDSIVDTYPSGQMAVPGQDVIVRLSQQRNVLPFWSESRKERWCKTDTDTEKGTFWRCKRYPRWVEAVMVSPEVENEKWRRLLLH